MKLIWNKLRIVMVAWVCIYPFVFSIHAAASESPGEEESASAAATDTRGDGEKADVKNEDILDRAFSPLDRAVSDINRDLNEGEDSAGPELSE